MIPHDVTDNELVQISVLVSHDGQDLSRDYLIQLVSRQGGSSLLNINMHAIARTLSIAIQIQSNLPS